MSFWRVHKRIILPLRDNIMPSRKDMPHPYPFPIYVKHNILRSVAETDAARPSGECIPEECSSALF